jgi:dTDP-4-amino-4,6-dideoxygalactose transaminase
MGALRIPFIDLRPLVSELRSDAEAAFKKVLDDHEFIGSTSVEKLETELAAHLGVKHAVAVSSCTLALTLALQTSNVRGGTVAMPNLTFWGTAEAIVNAGGTPLLIDSDPRDTQMSLDEFTRAHDQYRFMAAVPVHLFGWASERLEALRAFCREREIAVVDDGAQAFGVTDSTGKSVFRAARVSAISFHPAKVVGGIMDGGAVLTNDENIAERVRRLRDHGRVGHYDHITIGTNARMSGIGAAYLRLVVAQAARIIIDRRRQQLRYHDRLDRLKGMRLRTGSNGYLAVVTTDKPSEIVRQEMSDQGIDTGQVYPHTIVDQPGAIGFRRFGGLSVSKHFCEHVVNLPLYYGMPEEYVARVVAALEAAL